MLIFIELALPIISIFWGGFVASVLWGWFIVPLGVAPIGVLHASGIAIVVSAFLGSRGLRADHHAAENTSGHDRIGEAIVWTILWPLVVLFFGWLIRLMMS